MDTARSFPAPWSFKRGLYAPVPRAVPALFRAGKTGDTAATGVV